jgi:hypothetical protein
VAKYPFLSDAWMEAARAIRANYEGKGQPAEHPIRMNSIITEIPFPPGRLDGYLDTSAGEVVLELGHLPDADVTVTMPWNVARAVLVEGDQQIGMQAFLEGRIRIDGDLTKLMVLQAGALDPILLEAQALLRDITE